jgi:hypothetical protein
MRERPTPATDELGRYVALLLTATERRAEAAGVSVTEYMAGVLDGRYPRITREEVDDEGGASPRSG